MGVALAEAFGLKAGSDVDGPMITALRRLGFKAVFDTDFAAAVMDAVRTAQAATNGLNAALQVAEAGAPAEQLSHQQEGPALAEQIQRELSELLGELKPAGDSVRSPRIP